MSNDPYRFLEDLQTPATRQWVAQAHGETLSRFCRSDEFEFLKQDITRHLQDERQIPFCQEHRAMMYHFHQSAEHPKGVYRVCSAASYRAGLPQWSVLFAVADFDALLGDDVYLDGVSHYVEQPEKVLLSLSAGGGDAAYTLEFDLAAGKIVEDGFHFPLGKSHIAWRDADSVWVCPAWDERQLTVSGYPREVWLLRRGQAFSEAQPVFALPESGMTVYAWRYLDGQGAPVDLIEASHSFYQKDYYQVDAQGSVLPLNLPQDADVAGYLAGQLLLQLKSGWQRANRCYPAGALVAVKLNKGQLGEAHLLLAPDERQALESVETTKRFVVANVLDNVSGSLKAWKWQQGAWQEVSLPALPQGALNMTDQPWGGDVLYVAGSDFVTPMTLFALDLNVMELTVLRRQPQQFDATGIQVQQFYAPSADGTPVPYYHVGKNHTPDTPVLVYVYGGFNMPELPHYMGAIGRHWLAKGYAFVLANVRGGGEFVHWHEAAVRENKHKSVDDLLAVLEDVYRRGLGRPQQTAIQGGSNGGLVVASAFVRQPERMGALVCEVPLTDMLRYAGLYAGASWIEEYGDPEDPLMRPYLAQLSPYHQAAQLERHPPALITTNLADDRVHPAHALKFYAQLRAKPQARAWLYAPDSGGHTGNATQADTAADFACVLCFLQQSIVRPDADMTAA